MPRETLSFRRLRRVGALAAVVGVSLLTAVSSLATASATPRPGVPPGATSWLSQVQWTSQEVSPGVTVRSGVLSDPSAAPYWTVTIDGTTTSSITGTTADTELGTASWAAATASKLKADGYTPEVTAVPWPDYSDSPRGLEGYRVRTGDFPTQAAATTLATTLKSQGFTTAAVEWTGYDADQAPDGELIHEAVIDPGSADIEVTHAGIVGNAQVVTTAAAELGAEIVTDGGWGDPSGINYHGVPYSLGVYDGQIQSLGNLGRAALIIRNDHPEIADVDATATVSAGGSSYPINGINRVAGHLEGCGRPGSEPTSQPRQDISCTETSELVLDTAQLGVATESGQGTQATLGPDGTVLSVGAQTGGDVPQGGSIIQGIGAAGTWLTQHAVVGQRLTVSEHLATTTGQPIPLTPGLSVASAAPILVKNGQSDVDAVSEGVIDPADLSFNYAWSEIRQPRTIVGIGAGDQLIIVTVDGRQPGLAEGATLTEEADLMKSLGAVQAMNMDGGGSTALAVDGQLVNKPSNAGNAERANADFVVALPKPSR